jgi:hypothetical protein
MTLYRLNRITDRHLLKYLRLLGSPPGPAVPSKVELTVDATLETEFHKGDYLFTETLRKKIFFELDLISRSSPLS